jgi:hypothetical protein
MMTIELITAPVLCAWCGKQIGQMVPTGDFPDATGHGICDECAAVEAKK